MKHKNKGFILCLAVAAAAGLFNAVVAFVLVMTANTISKRYSRTSLW